MVMDARDGREIEDAREVLQRIIDWLFEGKDYEVKICLVAREKGYAG